MVGNSAFFLQRVTPCTLQMVTPRLAQSRGYTPRVEAFDSLVAESLTLRVTFLSQGTSCARKYERFLQVLDSNFYGLEFVDMNF